MRLIPTILLFLLVASFGWSETSVAASPRPWLEPRRADFGPALRFAADHPPIIDVVIATRDTILAHDHWRGGGLDRATNVKSVSKSLLSALVGIALERGDLDTVETPIRTWFSEHDDLFADPRRARITLEDLLTMRSGLETTSFYNYGAWVAGKNWVRGQLRMPVEFEPGTTMRYSTGASHLVSVILERATGVRPSVYADRHLFGPLGITGVNWDRDPQGHDFGGNNVAMTPRQMIRFGQLYLGSGELDGRRILPRSWIEASWRPRTRSHWNGYHYGYFWWTRDYDDITVHYAWGHGGQRIFVIPEADLVVAVTSGLRSNGRSGHGVNRAIDRMLVEHVLGALSGPPRDARR